MGTEGPLALVGGDELNPGNEPQDEVLVAAAGGGPAFVLATAAARQRPELAVAHAVSWFSGLGLEVEELPAVNSADANSPVLIERARRGRFFYLIGGDPELVPETLGGSPLWEAIVVAWRNGAALAGSSAGAMAMGEWTLAKTGSDTGRAYMRALGLIPRVAVVPHFDTFGKSWADDSLASAPRDDVVLLGADEATAALWQNGRWRALGHGGVTVITKAGRSTFASGDPIEGVPDPV